MDKEDYPPGYTVTPSEEWISQSRLFSLIVCLINLLEKEKKFFRRILKEPDETPLTREEEEKVLPNGRYASFQRLDGSLI